MKTDIIILSYEIDDGYVGHRPQSTTLNASELADCETWEDAKELINDAVNEDFAQKIMCRFDPEDYRERWEEARKAAQE